MRARAWATLVIASVLALLSVQILTVPGVGPLMKTLAAAYLPWLMGVGGIGVGVILGFGLMSRRF